MVTFKHLHKNVKAPFTLCAEKPKLDSLTTKAILPKEKGSVETRLPPWLVINLDKQISSWQYAQGLAKLTWPEEFFKNKDQKRGARAAPPMALTFIPRHSDCCMAFS